MGRLTPVHVVIVVIGVLLVKGSTQEDSGDNPTGNTKASFKGDVQEEVGLLCDELEEEKYSRNMTLFKLKLLPVERWATQENIPQLQSVGLLQSLGLQSVSLNISDDQLLDLLDPHWIEDQFEKQQQQKKLEKKIVIPQKALQVNALVVVDEALDKMGANSTQFVKEFVPLANHILGSVGIEIRISDILLESSERNFGLIQPLDDKHGLAKLSNPSAAFLWDIQKRELKYDIVLMLSGLDVCEPTDRVDKPFKCSILGIAHRSVDNRWPFFRRHLCSDKPAIVEVPKPKDRHARWLAAITTAHEVVPLIGTTSHDGENDYYGGGPGGEGCQGFNQHIMAPERDIEALYRVCKDYEPWSKCTIKQVQFFTAHWTRSDKY